MTRRRKQRLPLDAYEMPGSTWHITTTVLRSNGSPFLSIDFGLEVLEGFVSSCQKAGAVPHLVCIMPDHLHALIEVRSDDLTKVVGRAKSVPTRQWWARGGVGALWQESFHDHGIREPLDFDSTVVYLLNNPVDLGLAEEWESYPLIGGTVLSDE